MSMMRTLNKNLRKGRRKLAHKRFCQKVIKFFRLRQEVTLLFLFALSCILSYTCTVIPIALAYIVLPASFVLLIFLAFKLYLI